MSFKNIIIIGGGISGLATLHYLKSKYSRRDDIDIKLLEKNASLGGTATTVYSSNCVFESGPNGFLDSQKNTLQFVRDLNLEEQLISADPATKKRYLSINNKLQLLPLSPFQIFTFGSLSLFQKLRMFQEPFVRKGGRDDESVYEFGLRRLGQGFTEIFLDPFASGIFAGDIKQLNLKLTFPKIYDLEQQYGSLIKARMKLKKAPLSAGNLTSFKSGISQLALTLWARYKNAIVLNCGVHSIKKIDKRFLIEIQNKSFEADEVFLCAPAYEASPMLQKINPNLAKLLGKITYAPIAVVGLVFERTDFSQLPEGFGYLVPSKEKKKTLGVLFESNIFSNRTDRNHFLFRVMIGGIHHPEVNNISDEELIQMAKEELQKTFSLKKDPVQSFVKVLPRAIPQYDKTYFEIHLLLEKELRQEENFFIVSNYWGGVSLNDCILNAKNAAQNSRL